MLYLHDAVCLSPLPTWPVVRLDVPPATHNNFLTVVEIPHEGIPPNALRRMGKAVRMAVGSALPLLKHFRPQGIIIGTANGGMEDCIRFLNQIIDYDEGKLTPGNFVQSTANAAAAQVALITHNTGYNITHVHRGLAFEQALLDAVLRLKENPTDQLLLGAVDEVSAYNYNIDRLSGWYRDTLTDPARLFSAPEPGTIAGEGAVSFTVSTRPEGAGAFLRDMQTIHTEDAATLGLALQLFLQRNHPDGGEPALLITGENGDLRLQSFIDEVESRFSPDTAIGRFKQYCGEYCTASSFAVWLAMQIFGGRPMPRDFLKKGVVSPALKRIFICNQHRGAQHSFLLLERP